MKLFIDTANIDEIRETASWGIISGVTTNPSLIAKEGRDFHQVVQEICTIVNGPISAEVISPEWKGMVKEAQILAAIHRNVTIKVPMTDQGLKAVHALKAEDIKTNVTLIFSAAQALVAANAGATFVSPFVGRIDDVGQDGMTVVREIAEIFTNYGLDTEIIAASIRHPVHVVQAALCGCDIATVPYKILQQMLKHPLTDIGIDKFNADWEKVKSQV